MSRIVRQPADETGSQRPFRGITDCKIMNEDEKDRQSVYEIGYLIAASVPEENVPAEAEALKKVITDAGSSIIAEEMPHRERLAYTMRTKTVSGAYDKHDEAWFGWVKFEVGSDKIEALKKAVESRPSVLRMLLITTVRENTYLGKHAPVVATAMAPRRSAAEGALGDRPEEKKETAPASIEEMDKSIDEMVKEV